MPSKSSSQHSFMQAVAHNPAFAKKVGIPQSVGKDFDEADKGKKFGSGGRTRPDAQKVNKPKTEHGKSAFFNKGGDTMAKMNPGFMAMMAKKKAGAKAGGKAEMPMKKMNMGGMGYAKGGSASSRADGVATKGKTKGMMLKKGGMAC